MTTPTLPQRLLRVLIPTLPQALLAIIASLGFIIIGEWTAILRHVGVSASALQASGQAVAARFSVVSHSLLASNIALIAFWSAVGLAAYVICWWGYNLLIEARNEVTVKTRYQNQGHEAGIWIMLLIKLVCAAGLYAVIALLKYGAAFALALAAGLVSGFNILSLGAFLVGVIALAALIYLVFVFIQLTFSAWYHARAFTD